MRCKYCGGEISLEAAFCSYCGKPNEHAAEHAREMKKFRRAFENTRSGVRSTVKSYTGASVRLAIIALLIVLIVLLFVLGGQSYSLRRAIVQHRTEKNASTVMATMDELLAAEDFLAFHAYCEENYVDCYDSSFEKYAPVERASTAYSYVYRDIMAVASPPEYAALSALVSSLSEDLEYFYDTTDIEEYEYYDGADSEQNRAALAAMEDRIGLLLVTYCGIDAEDVAALPDMSTPRRGILLEEGVLSDE